MNITLQRLTYDDTKGTLGVLIIDNQPMFTTIEPPWKNNQTNISCIPAGTYKTVKIKSPRFKKDLYMLIDIPDRDAVEIHIGNKACDTHGCILLGTSFSLYEYAIINSEIALSNFMTRAPREGFTITIKDMNNETTITMPEKI